MVTRTYEARRKVVKDLKKEMSHRKQVETRTAPDTLVSQVLDQSPPAEVDDNANCTICQAEGSDINWIACTE